MSLLIFRTPTPLPRLPRSIGELQGNRKGFLAIPPANAALGLAIPNDNAASASSFAQAGGK
ncbi:MAG TPA: hypothetical protein VFB60_12795 [Ktedonobacteraceae bacterium]|nr:hypothetical protein [Ktedonobacteraceae bacterium]